jgi:glycerophosphoryl diester phosphodiesterase
MKRTRSLALCLALALVACDSGGVSSDLPDPSAAPRTGPVIIAHRGYSGIAPEHTVTAFDLAIQADADYLEQDLQMTADGVLVVLHDATLDRTARGPARICTGPVIQRTLSELRQCDFGSWFNERRPERAREEFAGVPVPTLEELFQRYGRSVRYYIETKNPEEAPGMEEALLELLRRYDLVGEHGDGLPRVLVQSFSPESLRKLHSMEEALHLVQLFGRMPSEEIRSQIDDVRGYAIGIGPHFSSVDAALVDAAHAAELVVHPYTVNEAAEMRRLFELGVDGVFTDETTLAQEQVRSLAR